MPANTETEIDLTEDISSYREIRIVVTNLYASTRHSYFDFDLKMIEEYGTSPNELYLNGLGGNSSITIVSHTKITFAIQTACNVVSVYARQ